MYNQPSGYGSQYSSFSPNMYSAGPPQGTANMSPHDQAMLSMVSHSLTANPMYQQHMPQQYYGAGDMGSYKTAT